MATTFLKRQKEMKRLEKQREKAERRAQKKLAGRTGEEGSMDNTNPAGEESSNENAVAPAESEPQN